MNYNKRGWLVLIKMSFKPASFYCAEAGTKSFPFRNKIPYESGVFFSALQIKKARYVKKQKQIKNSTNSVTYEKEVEISMSEAYPLYTKLTDDGKLTLNDNNKIMEFERK